MPNRPPRICGHPGCKALTTKTHCAKHEAEHVAIRTWQGQRGSAASRGYGGKWPALRKRILNRDPFCMAPGCSSPSEHADHIKPKHLGGSDRESNLQGLCRRHHDEKTRREALAARGKIAGAPGTDKPRRG